MDKDQLLAIVKKHRERFALGGLAVALLIFIGSGIYLQKHRDEKEKDPALTPLRIELPKEESSAGGQQGGRQQAKKSQAYFLRPSPKELLAQLADMEKLNEDVLEQKFVSMPVLWPGYFFAVEYQGGVAQLIVDVEQDGFGVVLRGEVSLAEFPQVQQFTRGEKVWLGGEIVAVDPSGTGTVYLAIDHLSNITPQKLLAE